MKSQTVTPERERRGVGPSMPRLLVAPDSFKGTYTSLDVARAIAAGSDGEVDVCPLADGGENTMAVLLAAGSGRCTTVDVHDPLGRPVTAALGWTDGGATAIVECALASGLGLVSLHERDAEAASSLGTGELIAGAAGAGASRIIVGLGGSACTDGGAGAVEAIERSGGLRDTELVVLCDVTTPFEDAAVLYAPQKGADATTVRRLTQRLARYAGRLPRDPRGVAMTGAAGGTAGALWAMYDAQLVSGASWILDAVEFDARLARADVVVTGEGSFDRQTLEGKLVAEVAARCGRADKPLHVVAGRSSLPETETSALGVRSVHLASDARALTAVGALVTRTAAKELSRQ
jgi:glycerate 2-kinase